jgi:hypothetical protein
LLIFEVYYWTLVHFCNCLHFLAEPTIPITRKPQYQYWWIRDQGN